MASSPQQNLNRHHLLLITLLHLLGNQASTQATGLNAQHVAGIDPPGTICSCMNTQKPPNSIPHTSKVESSGRADSACSHSCLMSCSDSERRSDIPDTEGRGLGVSLTEVSRKRPVVLWEAGTSLPETACATVSPALSPFHFLGLDENKVKKQRWVIFHPPAPELQKPSVLRLPPEVHRPQSGRRWAWIALCHPWPCPGVECRGGSHCHPCYADSPSQSASVWMAHSVSMASSQVTEADVTSSPGNKSVSLKGDLALHQGLIALHRKRLLNQSPNKDGKQIFLGDSLFDHQGPTHSCCPSVAPEGWGHSRWLIAAHMLRPVLSTVPGA